MATAVELSELTDGDYERTKKQHNDESCSSPENPQRTRESQDFILSQQYSDYSAPERQFPELRDPLSQPGRQKDGCYAWLVCLSSFLIQALVVGILHCYGVFYMEFMKEFKASSAESAWIGSGAYGITMAVAPISSIVITKWGPRTSAILGCLLCAAGLVLSSFAQNIGTLFGTFTVIFALGACFAYTPCMTIACDYFSKYVTVATGFMVAGTSTGTLVLNPLAQFLCDNIGWRNALRVFTANCFIGIVCSLSFAPLQKKKKDVIEKTVTSNTRERVRSLELWKNKVYILWSCAIFLVMFGYYIPYVHLMTHAIQIGISPSRAAIVLMTLGASVTVGRVAFGKIVTLGYLHHLHMDQLSMIITGTATILLPLIKNFYGLLAYVMVVGLVDGCYTVLLPTLTAAFCAADQRVFGWGVLNLVASITFTLGPPVAGWIKDATGNYDLAFHIAGIPVILGAVLLFFIPWAQRTANTVNVRLLVATKSFQHISVTQVNSATDVDNALASEELNQAVIATEPRDGSKTVTVRTKGSSMTFNLTHKRIRLYSSHTPIVGKSIVDEVFGSNDRVKELFAESRTRALSHSQEPHINTSAFVRAKSARTALPGVKLQVQSAGSAPTTHFCQSLQHHRQLFNAHGTSMPSTNYFDDTAARNTRANSDFNVQTSGSCRKTAEQTTPQLGITSQLSTIQELQQSIDEDGYQPTLFTESFTQVDHVHDHSFEDLAEAVFQMSSLSVDRNENDC